MNNREKISHDLNQLKIQEPQKPCNTCTAINWFCVIFSVLCLIFIVKTM